MFDAITWILGALTIVQCVIGFMLWRYIIWHIHEFYVLGYSVNSSAHNPVTTLKCACKCGKPIEFRVDAAMDYEDIDLWCQKRDIRTLFLPYIVRM